MNCEKRIRIRLPKVTWLEMQREYFGISRRHLSVVSGVPVHRILDFEIDEATPTIGEAIRISVFLRSHIPWFNELRLGHGMRLDINPLDFIR